MLWFNGLLLVGFSLSDAAKSVGKLNEVQSTCILDSQLDGPRVRHQLTQLWRLHLTTWLACQLHHHTSTHHHHHHINSHTQLWRLHLTTWLACQLHDHTRPHYRRHLQYIIPFIVRLTYDSDLKRAKIDLRNITSLIDEHYLRRYYDFARESYLRKSCVLRKTFCKLDVRRKLIITLALS